MFNFVSLFHLKRPYPLASRFHHQKYQQVVEKANQKAIQNPRRAIATALTYRFISNPTTKHSAIFQDIMQYNFYMYTKHDVPIELVSFQVAKQ